MAHIDAVSGHVPLTNPRTAVVWAVLAAELGTSTVDRSVVDIGGGTGGFAVPLAQLGHAVTVVDPSPDALAALARRAAESGVSDRVRALQGDADTLADLIPPDSTDLVLCHAVLEVVDDPSALLAAVASVLRRRGVLSLLVANRAAAVLARAVGGHIADAARLLAEPAVTAPAHPPPRRFDGDSARTLLSAAGLTVEQIHGVRVVADLVSGVAADNDPAALVELELAAAARSPYREIATQLHLLARKD